MSGASLGKVRLLLFDDDHGQADLVHEMLRSEEMDLSLASHDLEQALQQVRNVSPDVILLADSRRALPEIVERFDSVSGGSPIVTLLTPEQLEGSREILLAGARALLPLSTSRDDLVDTIVSVLERERRRRAALAKQLGVEVDLGKLIAVHGAKGGVGATSIAVNLAVAIQQATRKRVALVDANLYSGDVAATLNLMSRTSLADLTPHLKELDEEFLGRASVHHSSGLRVFLAPDDFVRAQTINGEQISRILQVMRQNFDYIIVDTCSLPDQVTSAALEEANRVLLVTTPEVPALKNAARFFKLADDFGYRDKISLVLNRAKSRAAVNVADIEEHLRAPIAISIPSDGKNVPSATNAGVPVVMNGRSRFGSGVWYLMTLVTGVSAKNMKNTSVHEAARDLSHSQESASVRMLNLAGEGAANGTAKPVVVAPSDAARGLFNRIRGNR